MKKLLALMLAVCMVLSLAACGTEPNNETETNTESDTIVVDGTAVETPDEKDDDVKEEAKTETKTEDKKEEAPADKKEEKPAEMPTTPEVKPETKPEEKPATPVETPAEKPAEKPAETPKTVGNTLLADFKAKAGSASSALSLAESLSANSIIPFMMGAMEVEPGLLSGFDNAEITGFKEGAVFMPMIGSHPFIGYVFFLEDGTNTSDFIANLKANANLRWNICVTADEMVAGNVGNKVFFVMCPASFDAE